MRIEKSLLVQRILLLWFWVMCCYGFINDELLGFNLTVRSLCLVFVDFTILLLALWTIREKWDFLIIGSFTVISWWSTCVANGLSLVTWVNGSRVFFGLLFILPVLRYFWQNEARRERFIKEIDRTLLLFLYVQAFCIAWQFIRYGAGDRVGGSFGNGFSGMASFSIYLSSFYLMKRRIDSRRFISSLCSNWHLIALLLPTFFNETKVSFILIVFYFFLLVDIDRKWFQRMIIVVPIALLLFISGFTIYIDNVANPTGEGDLQEYMTGQDLDLDYELGAVEWNEQNSNQDYDIPRIVKLAFIGFVFTENPENLTFGFGTGIFKGGTTLDENPFSQTYDWLVLGTNPYVCHVIFQLGLVGCVWVIILFVSFFVRKPTGTDDRNVSMQLYFLLFITIMVIYADSWRDMPYSFFMLLFLTLSWVPVSTRSSTS